MLHDAVLNTSTTRVPIGSHFKLLSVSTFCAPLPWQTSGLSYVFDGKYTEAHFGEILLVTWNPPAVVHDGHRKHQKGLQCRTSHIQEHQKRISKARDFRVAKLFEDMYFYHEMCSIHPLRSKISPCPGRVNSSLVRVPRHNGSYLLSISVDHVPHISERVDKSKSQAVETTGDSFKLGTHKDLVQTLLSLKLCTNFASRRSALQPTLSLIHI